MDFAVSAGVSTVPEVPLVLTPGPVRVQDVVLEELQVSVQLEPLLIKLRVAEMDRLGAGGGGVG